MTTVATFRIRPISASWLEALRASGHDISENPVHRQTAVGGEPLRCCLRDARPGEQIILFGYEPPIPGSTSPYRESGAVFAHAEDCIAPAGWDVYPAQWHGRPQVLRAYDWRGWIHPATTTHDGTDPAGALTRVLAQPGVLEVHSRNIAYGCFMFAAAYRFKEFRS